MDLLLPALDASSRYGEGAKRARAHRSPPPRLRAADDTSDPRCRRQGRSQRNRGALLNGKRPASGRGGINLRSLFDTGSVEFRLPNGSLDPDAIDRTVELWLRWIAAVGHGEETSRNTRRARTSARRALSRLSKTPRGPSLVVAPTGDRPRVVPVLLPHCQHWFRELYPQVREAADIVWIDGGRNGSIVALAEGDRSAHSSSFVGREGGRKGGRKGSGSESRQHPTGVLNSSRTWMCKGLTGAYPPPSSR